MDNVPSAFDYASEANKFLARVKKKAATKFAFTRQSSLVAACDLAFWLYVHRRDEEAAKVCRFVAQTEFTGNFNLWSWVEIVLSLNVRLVSSSAEKRALVNRIKEAGFEESRLAGSLLSGKDGYRACIEQSVKDGETTFERDWRMVALKELSFIIALGGSKKLPVSKAEAEFQTHLRALQVLLGI